MNKEENNGLQLKSNEGSLSGVLCYFTIWNFDKLLFTSPSFSFSLSFRSFRHSFLLAQVIVFLRYDERYESQEYKAYI